MHLSQVNKNLKTSLNKVDIELVFSLHDSRKAPNLFESRIHPLEWRASHRKHSKCK